jgi:hypothetical protein
MKTTTIVYRRNWDSKDRGHPFRTTYTNIKMKTKLKCLRIVNCREKFVVYKTIVRQTLTAFLHRE